MFSAASTAPAPSPYGIAHRHSIQNALEVEKPSSAAAVMPTLITVTTPAPKRRVRRSEARLEMIVPIAMIIVTMPAKATGTPRSWCITGQPAPTRESGRPRLMKAR